MAYRVADGQPIGGGCNSSTHATNAQRLMTGQHPTTAQRRVTPQRAATRQCPVKVQRPATAQLPRQHNAIRIAKPPKHGGKERSKINNNKHRRDGRRSRAQADARRHHARKYIMTQGIRQQHLSTLAEPQAQQSRNEVVTNYYRGSLTTLVLQGYWSSSSRLGPILDCISWAVEAGSSHQ